jgi:hypothetical protein
MRAVAKRPLNPSVGTVQCPIKGCEVACSVHRFRARTNASNSRFAGRFYLVCEHHGRIGGDPKDSATQAYIEKHAKLDSGAAGSVPRPLPPSRSSAPAAPASDGKKKSRNGAATPAPPETPQQQPAPAEPKSRGWF